MRWHLHSEVKGSKPYGNMEDQSMCKGPEAELECHTDI